MQIIKTDLGPRRIYVEKPKEGTLGKAYFSLGSNLWKQLTGGSGGKTWSFEGTKDWPWKEHAKMILAEWEPKAWYSAQMRLEMALGYGLYRQTIQVGKGSGLCTTFYLCERDTTHVHEIDFEFSGHCYPPTREKPYCGTATVWTNVFPPDHGETTKLWSYTWSRLATASS
jgi:hypothetical protein